ncbi:hypothetical protein GCM10027399_06560 [Curvibacter fontanus]|jgi:putative FmdB family regulatory protein
MPIYAYKCESCGAAKDVLQKISDPTLSDCPACGQPTFRKQVTAAGFQLKGSGWYATDFRGGATPAAAPTTAAAATTSEAPAAAAPASHSCGTGCGCA